MSKKQAKTTKTMIEVKRPLTSAEYRADGLRRTEKCPSCGSPDITGYGVDIEPGVITQERSCARCCTTWTARYKIDGYQDLVVAGVCKHCGNLLKEDG